LRNENTSGLRGNVVSDSRDYGTSVDGFFPLADSGREVFNFNNGWLFCIGDVAGAERADYDDSSWECVSVPHCVKLEPSEASGGRNYQGVAWYRKHFVMPRNDGSKRWTLHFEAIMGKQKVYVNGRLAAEHEGGYLPIIIDLTSLGVKAGEKCVVAVMADNSNDRNYPPGKTQLTLDFCYHGGMYRDVWLIGKNEVSISDAMTENKVAGGGVFVHYENISDDAATVIVNTDVRNASAQTKTVSVSNQLLLPDGKTIGTTTEKIKLAAGASQTVVQRIRVKHPQLWSPESPVLYDLATRLKVGGKNVDGGLLRIGIRSIEFRGAEGFFLNGKRYRQFVGANRHQDFAYVGNALPNSQQWRDAKRLKNAGFNIIRTAHYPQDPSFMDACDELGIFIIVATPGWQFWNKDPQFAEKVQQNTRLIIRRDRNHPSVLMWEPILNETRFPEDFSLKALQVTKDEYPYPYRPAAAADVHSAGVKDNYDVVYGWPGDDEKTDRPKQCILTREFGEYVDDWYAHNAINRASRSWGERPMMQAALSLMKTATTMHQTTGQFIGGCLWHPFDHQRGYHPDPYWGGIFDAFRQPKTAYYMFRSQIDQSEPFIYIAHEMMPSSENDVVVFTNCDSVRLSMYDGDKQFTKAAERTTFPQAVVFEDAWDSFEARSYSYTKKSPQKVNIVAEGFTGGKKVCEDRRMPSRRSTKLCLTADEMGKQIVADGSDFIVVVAEVTDDNGNVRRLAKENIVFSVEGEGEIIGDASIGANPRQTEWGSAPVLIRSTRKAGKIKIHAEVEFGGTHAPTAADLEIESVAPVKMQFEDGIVTASETNLKKASDAKKTNAQNLSEEEKRKMLQEVEQQQADFGIK